MRDQTQEPIQRVWFHESQRKEWLLPSIVTCSSLPSWTWRSSHASTRHSDVGSQDYRWTLNSRRKSLAYSENLNQPPSHLECQDNILYKIASGRRRILDTNCARLRTLRSSVKTVPDKYKKFRIPSSQLLGGLASLTFVLP